MDKPNLAVYIGKFDPMHKTHLVEALTASSYFDLDVMLLLTDQEGSSDIKLRERVALESIAGHPRLSLAVENEELNRFNYIHKLSRDHDLYVLWGLDVLMGLRSSLTPFNILNNCNIITTARPGYEFTDLADYLPPGIGYTEEDRSDFLHPNGLIESGVEYRAWLNRNKGGKRIFYVNFPTEGISGTEVRQQLAQGNDITHMMANAAAARIYSEASEEKRSITR